MFVGLWWRVRGRTFAGMRELLRDAAERAARYLEDLDTRPVEPRDVRLTRFRGMGWQDVRHPNNEFVQVGVRPNGPKRVKLAGWSLRSRAGESYTFPADTVVTRGTGLRVYSGEGRDTETTLFWNRDSPVWDDMGDCVELIDPRGDVMQVQHFGRRADGWCD